MVGSWVQAGIASHEIVPVGTKIDDGTPLDDDGIAGHVPRGVAQMKVVREAGLGQPTQSRQGFSARQIKLLAGEDPLMWFWLVLDAHGWWSLVASEPDPDLVQRVEAKCPGILTEARQYGGNWGVFILEIAAVHFCEPLSRLWYAANILSMFHCHRDDLRFGYLLAEYRMKQRWEQPALAHEALADRNRENGKKGGQADIRRRRVETLDRLVLESLHRMTTVLPDRDDYIKFARERASEYGRETGDGLFTVSGRALAPSWYEDWFAAFKVKLQLGQPSR